MPHKKRSTNWLQRIAYVVTPATLLAILILLLWLVFGPIPGPAPEVQQGQEVKQLFGWAGKDEADAAWKRIGHLFPRFQIVGAAKDNSKSRVVLWDFAKAVNGGNHLPTLRQEIGDCVGFGAGNAVRYLMAVQLARDHPEQEFHEIFVPYHYACGRNAKECGNGRMGRDPDGSVGSWQAKAVELYGVLHADLDGLPKYSASTARQWAIKMPAPKYVDEGKTHLVRTTAQVNSPAEVRDAICNGYPCTIASNWGGMMHPPVVDGRLVNKRVTSWGHQMCIIGYDGTGREPYYYILNSWGPDAHGDPPDDSVPGGFWVREGDVAYIVRQGDSFAYSQFDGFLAQDTDWIIIKAKAARKGAKAASDHHVAIGL